MPKYDALLRYGPPHLAWKDDTQRQMRSIRPYVLPEKQQEHDIDPPSSDSIGLKSGGAIKNALRIAKHYSGATKVSKTSVNYSKGMPKSHCGICRFYQGGSCTKVQGKIDPAYWCKLWKKKD